MCLNETRKNKNKKKTAMKKKKVLENRIRTNFILYFFYQ